MGKRQTQTQSRWLQRQRRDCYTQQAQREQLRSRAWFKLQQIHQKHPDCFKPGIVLDLGSAPGGWSAYLAEHLPSSAYRIVACDRLAMAPIRGVEFFQGDFLSETFQSELEEHLSAQKASTVLSDLAPNLTGCAWIDQAQSFALADSAYDFCQRWLATGGHFLIKVFSGHESESFYRSLQLRFEKVKRIKPHASRSASKELYFLALHFKGR